MIYNTACAQCCEGAASRCRQRVVIELPTHTGLITCCDVKRLWIFYVGSSLLITLTLVLIGPRANSNMKHIDPDLLNPQRSSALQLAQERIEAPEGFVKSFRDLLSEIRLRNARLTASSINNPNINRTPHLHNTSHRQWLNWARPSTLRLRLSWVSAVQDHLWRASAAVVESSSWRGWILGLCVAGFAYFSLKAVLSWATRILTVLWQIFSPGGIEEL